MEENRQKHKEKDRHKQKVTGIERERDRHKETDLKRETVRYIDR